MQPIAIVLLIISAFSHAGWNLLSKRVHPTAAYFMLTTATASVLAAPMVLFGFHDVLGVIPPTAWLLVILSGFFEALYYSMLAGAYRSGDISLAYPLVRSSPIIVVTVMVHIFGRGEEVGRLCVIGIILVVAGCFLLPLQRFSRFKLKNYLKLCCLLALVAAFGSAGYSITDDEALKRLRALPEIGPVRAAIVYIWLIYAATSLWLAVVTLASGFERRALKRFIADSKKWVVTTGILSMTTYALVLVSMAFVRNVSYVVAFRQMSIPIGAYLGILLLKEKPCLPKIIGTAVIFVGLVFVAVG